MELGFKLNLASNFSCITYTPTVIIGTLLWFTPVHSLSKAWSVPSVKTSRPIYFLSQLALPQFFSEHNNFMELPGSFYLPWLHSQAFFPEKPALSFNVIFIWAGFLDSHIWIITSFLSYSFSLHCSFFPC